MSIFQKTLEQGRSSFLFKGRDWNAGRLGAQPEAKRSPDVRVSSGTEAAPLFNGLSQRTKRLCASNGKTASVATPDFRLKALGTPNRTVEFLKLTGLVLLGGLTVLGAMLLASWLGLGVPGFVAFMVIVILVLRWLNRPYRR